MFEWITTYKSNILNPSNICARCTSACKLASRVKVTVACLLVKTDTTQVRKGYLKGAYYLPQVQLAGCLNTAVRGVMST